MTIMQLFSNQNVAGHVVNLNQTHPMHIGITGEARRTGDKIEASFADALVTAVADANTLQKDAEAKVNQYVMNPDSISIDDVTVALTKSENALSLMKNITDRVIQAYRELTQLR